MVIIGSRQPEANRGSARSLRAGSCPTGRDSPGRPLGNFFDLVFFLLDRHERHLEEECPDRPGWQHFRSFFKVDGSAAIACDFESWRWQDRAGEEARQLPEKGLNINYAAAINNLKIHNTAGLRHRAGSDDVASG